MPLSDTTVRNTKPGDKQRKLSDEKGLYLLVHPNGSKYWRYKYRFHGKEKTLALGVYPAVTLSEAREKRDDARKLLAKDPPVDPSTYKQAQKTTRRISAENSFEAVAREWIATHMANRSASHTDRVLRRFELYLFPWLRAGPISDITPPQLLEPLKRIQKLNKLETAHRVLQSAGQVFRYAVHTGKAQRDITADLKGALPPTVVKHMAALTKPEDVAELLRAIDGFTGTLTVQSALRLAPLVFVRPNELRKARWTDMDLKAAEWSYNLSKAQPGHQPVKHLVPLPHQAVQILEELYPYSGHGEYVFMGGHDPKKPMSEAAVNAALRRMGYDTQTQITGHGFRAMARTILHEKLGFDPNVIEHQLGHTVPDILGTAYNRTKFIDQRREMMQAWADYLDKLKAGGEKQ